MTNLVALAVATMILVAIPGPNVALIVARSLQHGFWSGLQTVIGTTIGVALQLLIVVLGVAALIETAAGALSIIKWVGVVYLIVLGAVTFRREPEPLIVEEPPRAERLIWQGTWLAVLNPKTLLFNAAFLPQFVNPEAGAAGSLPVLAVAYLVVLFAGDLLWAAFAAKARSWIERFGAARNRVSGSLLAAAGIGLALANRTD